MNNTPTWLLAGLAGAALGMLFFGGLWWTVRKSLFSARPALWMFGSLLLRMGVTMTGFYLVAGGDWQRLLICLIGFLIARHVMTKLTRWPDKRQTHQPQGARHAP